MSGHHRRAIEHYRESYSVEDEDGLQPILGIRYVKRRKDGRGPETPCHQHDKVPRNMEIVSKVLIEKESSLEALHIPKVQCDKYDPKLSDRPIKKDINLKYLAYLTQYPRDNRRVVILDSPAALTTQTLCPLVSADRLLVPNPDAHFLKKAPRNFSRMATYSNDTVYLWCLKNDAQHQYDFGLDYTCTFLGDEKVKPVADISTILQKKLFPKHNGILWLTVSRRRKGGQNTSAHVHEFMMKKGASEGYKFECLEEATYAGGMIYFFFRSVQNVPELLPAPFWTEAQKKLAQLISAPEKVLKKRKRQTSPMPVMFSKRQRTQSTPQVKTRSQLKKERKTQGRQTRQDTFAVDRLLKVQETAEGKRLYLVKWCGFSKKDATWEPASHLRKHQSEMSVLNAKLNEL
jgi:hypothetical protein